MLHLIAQPEPEAPLVYAEAVSRLASVRHALRLVDGGLAAGPEDDCDDEIMAAWPQAGEAKQYWFERRSSRLIGTAAAGIEALLSQRQKDCEPHFAASQVLVDEIRRELCEVAGIVLANG